MTVDAPDEAVVEQWYGIRERARQADHPDMPRNSRSRVAATIRVLWPTHRRVRLMAYLGDVPVGWAALAMPTLDNVDNVDLEIVVDPGYRRRGVGSALYREALTVARADGRKRFIVLADEEFPGGPSRGTGPARFLASHGFTPAHREAQRRLDIGAVDDAALDAMLADAYRRAGGYSLVRWHNGVPDEYLADVAYLDGRLNTDAPIGDLVLEAEKIDGARVRATEAACDQFGDQRYGVGVRHDASGRLVAFSVIMVEAEVPEHGWQYITIVDPEHRGHRLGTIVKIENLRHARSHQPELREIDTWNAETNRYMIDINEALGFRQVAVEVSWQRDL